MSSATAESRAPLAVRARILNEAVIVDLRDGRTVTAPLEKWLSNRKALARKRMQRARANPRAQSSRRRARG